MRSFLLSFLAYLLLFMPLQSLATPVVLDSVPSYNWYHGCSPTASAMIMGYWDLHGYDNLFVASGWAAVSVTANIQDQISSPAHNAKYDPKPDNPDLPAPPDTSLADFMYTSEENLDMGSTYLSNIDDAIKNYAKLMGYNFDSSYIDTSWENYIREIDLGNPVILNVDSSGNDGIVDHTMTGIGYENRGVNGLWYASYNTWHEAEEIDWYQYQPLSTSYSFGLHSMAYVHPLIDPLSPAPIPEPTTMLLFGIGILGGCPRMLFFSHICAIFRKSMLAGIRNR